MIQLTCNGDSTSFSLLVGQICFSAIIASLQNFSPITSSSSRPYLSVKVWDNHFYFRQNMIKKVRSEAWTSIIMLGPWRQLDTAYNSKSHLNRKRNDFLDRAGKTLSAIIRWICVTKSHKIRQESHNYNEFRYFTTRFPYLLYKCYTMFIVQAVQSSNFQSKPK